MRRWLAMNQPGLSAAENELWVPANTTSLRGSSHRDTEPLQARVEETCRADPHLGLVAAGQDQDEAHQGGNADRARDRRHDEGAAA